MKTQNRSRGTKLILKISAVILTLILFGQNSEAQILKSRFGFKVGANLSSLNVTNVEDEKILPGYDIGAFVRLQLTKGFALQPELNFSTKGAELSYTTGDGSTTSAVHLQYFEIPVLGVFSLTNHFNLQLGPYGSYLGNVNVVHKSGSTTSNISSQIADHNFKAIDYGLAGGAGLDIGLLACGLRYFYGLRNVGEEQNESNPNYTLPNAKNTTAQVYVGLSF